uniref:CARD domain-containing protein n=1 Tax=Pygocentrus nattereri TaxID=42514 RepID=A0AAR2IKQ7_PYGNA
IKMSALSEKELNGCRTLLALLSAGDLLALSDTVTNRLVCVESPREAIEAIVAYSQSAEELLKRRRVHREVIFKYLAKEGVVVPPNSEKHQLVKRTLELWSSGNVGIKTCHKLRTYLTTRAISMNGDLSTSGGM